MVFVTAALIRAAALGLTTLSLVLPAQASPELNKLARDIERVEAIRDIKDVQKSLTHLAQFGRWADTGLLFTQNATLR